MLFVISQEALGNLKTCRKCIELRKLHIVCFSPPKHI
jgi:hypothetical protein